MNRKTTRKLNLNTILLRSSPDHSIIRATEEEADRHDCQVVIHILQHTKIRMHYSHTHMHIYIQSLNQDSPQETSLSHSGEPV